MFFKVCSRDNPLLYFVMSTEVCFNSLTIYAYIFCNFIVGATTLVISQVPASAVKEGTTVTFKCASDEGNPPPLIHWNQSRGNKKVKQGRFIASTAESTMSIKVDRSWNQKEISCFIIANESRSQKSLEKKLTLSVQCESFYCFV